MSFSHANAMPSNGRAERARTHPRAPDRVGPECSVPRMRCLARVAGPDSRGDALRSIGPFVGSAWLRRALSSRRGPRHRLSTLESRVSTPTKIPRSARNESSLIVAHPAGNVSRRPRPRPLHCGSGPVSDTNGTFPASRHPNCESTHSVFSAALPPMAVETAFCV